MLSCQFILGADNWRFKEIKKALANAFTLGSDDYPKTMSAALALLKNYKPTDKSSSNNNNNHGDVNEVAFVAAGSSSDRQTSSSKADYKANMECFICGKKGHSMYKCDTVTPKDRDRHIADHKHNVMSKTSAAKKPDSKVGTQHTAVKADDDDDSVATIELGADGKPTYEFFLKE